MKLAVLVPGFGDPHWDHKVQILRNNIRTVGSFHWDVTWYVCQYNLDSTLPDDITSMPNIKVIKDKGILGQNIHKHMSPEQIGEYDYVLIMLDDVELVQPVNWQYVLQIKEKTTMDIVSPCLTDKAMSVWNFMIHDKAHPHIHLKCMTRCELFCYLMDGPSYKKYYQHVDPENPWMWGMDFILKSHMGLNVGIMNHVQMKHHYWRTKDTHDPKHDPRTDSDKYLAKYGTQWAELYRLPSELHHVFTST
jgi:hypothetical protein